MVESGYDFTIESMVTQLAPTTGFLLVSGVWGWDRDR